MGWLIHCVLLLSVVLVCSAQWHATQSQWTPPQTRRPFAHNRYRQPYRCREANLQYDCIFYDVSIGSAAQLPVSFGHDDVALNNQKNITFKNSVMRILPESLLSSFPKVELLDLTELQIEIIEERALAHGYFLRELYMSSNNIRQLPSATFSAMQSLRVLMLDRNELTNLPDGIFLHTPNLSVLSITNNKLERINDNTFTLNHALQHLQLSGNRLNRIDLSLIPNLFYGNVSANQLTTITIPSAMIELDASHNHINQVAGEFYNQLQLLRLQHNKLNDTAWLLNYPELVEVDLSYNELEQITHQHFRQMKQLEKLYVSNNRLFTLTLGSAPIQTLQILDLGHNHLVHVEYNQKQFNLLKQLYLHHNSIVTLKISADNALETLTLSNNDWDCNNLRAMLPNVSHHENVINDNDFNCKPDYKLEQNFCCKESSGPYLDRLVEYIHQTISAEKVLRAEERCNHTNAINSVQDLFDYLSTKGSELQLNPQLQAEIDQLQNEIDQLTTSQSHYEKHLHSLETEIDDNLRRYRVTKDPMVPSSRNLHKVIAHLKSRQAFKSQESKDRRSEADRKQQEVETLEQENIALQNSLNAKTEKQKSLQQEISQKRYQVKQLEAKRNQNPDTRRITK